MASVPEAGDGIASVGLDAVAPRLSANAAILAAYVALCAFSLLPFLLIEHPPIVDFANHAARLHPGRLMFRRACCTIAPVRSAITRAYSTRVDLHV